MPPEAAENIGPIVQRLGGVGRQHQRPVKTLRRASLKRFHLFQKNAAIAPGLGVIRLQRQQPVEITQRRFAAFQRLQQNRAFTQRLDEIGPQRQRRVIRVQRFFKPAPLRQRDSARLRRRTSEIGLCRQGLVETGQGFGVTAALLQGDAIIDQRLRMLARLRIFSASTNQVHGLFIAALLQL